MPAAVQAPANRPNEALTSVPASSRVLIHIGLLLGGILSCCHTMPWNLFYPKILCCLRDYHLYISSRLSNGRAAQASTTGFNWIQLDSSRHNRGLGRDGQQNQQVIPDFRGCRTLSPSHAQCLRGGSLTSLFNYHLPSHLLVLLHNPPLSSPLSNHPVTFLK